MQLSRESQSRYAFVLVIAGVMGDGRTRVLTHHSSSVNSAAKVLLRQRSKRTDILIDEIFSSSLDCVVGRQMTHRCEGLAYELMSVDLLGPKLKYEYSNAIT